MGRSASAELHYGYDLGSSEVGWRVAGVAEYASWRPAGCDLDEGTPDDELVEWVAARLRAEVSGWDEPEPDVPLPDWADRAAVQAWRAAREPWVRRQAEADRRVGVSVQTHGYAGDGSSYLLVAGHGYADDDPTTLVQVECGAARRVDWRELELGRVRGGWDARLDRALAALQLEPTEPRGWLLVAAYG